MPKVIKILLVVFAISVVFAGVFPFTNMQTKKISKSEEVKKAYESLTPQQRNELKIKVENNTATPEQKALSKDVYEYLTLEQLTEIAQADIYGTKEEQEENYQEAINKYNNSTPEQKAELAKEIYQNLTQDPQEQLKLLENFYNPSKEIKEIVDIMAQFTQQDSDNVSKLIDEADEKSLENEIKIIKEYAASKGIYPRTTNN